MTQGRAVSQDIRPLQILLVNMMPKKIQTEVQFSRLLGNTSLQIELELVSPQSHIPQNTPPEHLQAFYKTFDEVRDRNFDGCIITGAPVEHLDFEQVDYWDELCEIMDWARGHVFSTMYLCWGAMAGLYHLYGVRKYMLPEKLFGVFPQRLMDEYDFLTNGFDELHNMPHSRHAALNEDDLARAPKLKTLSESSLSGPALIASPGYHEVFVTGHFEYGRDTLSGEYWRDANQGLRIKIPVNYFPNDDPNNPPIFTWRSHANLLYRNWINWIYQMTTYELERIPEAIVAASDSFASRF
jgi:homoserine O-succinyltransferase